MLWLLEPFPSSNLHFHFVTQSIFYTRFNHFLFLINFYYFHFHSIFNLCSYFEYFYFFSEQSGDIDVSVNGRTRPNQVEHEICASLSVVERLYSMIYHSYSMIYYSTVNQIERCCASLVRHAISYYTAPYRTFIYHTTTHHIVLNNQFVSSEQFLTLSR